MHFKFGDLAGDCPAKQVDNENLDDDVPTATRRTTTNARSSYSFKNMNELKNIALNNKGQMLNKQEKYKGSK